MAWASDEHILPVDSHHNEKGNSSKGGGGGIVVAQEVNVTSEQADERGGSGSPDSGRLRGDDWAVRNMVSVGGHNSPPLNSPAGLHRMG